MGAIIDPFDTTPQSIVSRQQTRQQALQSSQQEMAARGLGMQRTGQEMGIAAQKTPAELQALSDNHQKFLQEQAAKGQYKLNAGDNELIKKLADQYAISQIIAPRSAAFMTVQGHGDNAVPTGPIYDTVPFSPLPNVAMNLSPDRDRLAQMQAINQATWAMTKPTGAGQIRQFEASDWKHAFPNMANLGPVNDSIDQRNQQEAADLAAKYNLVTQYVQQGKSPAQALSDFAAQKKATVTKSAPSAKYLGVYTPPVGGGGGTYNIDTGYTSDPDTGGDTGGDTGADDAGDDEDA